MYVLCIKIWSLKWVTERDRMNYATLSSVPWSFSFLCEKKGKIIENSGLIYFVLFNCRRNIGKSYRRKDRTSGSKIWHWWTSVSTYSRETVTQYRTTLQMHNGIQRRHLPAQNFIHFVSFKLKFFSKIRCAVFCKHCTAAF